MQDLGASRSGVYAPPGLQMATFSRCAHRVGGNGQASSLVSSYQGAILSQGLHPGDLISPQRPHP